MRKNLLYLFVFLFLLSVSVCYANEDLNINSLQIYYFGVFNRSTNESYLQNPNQLPLFFRLNDNDINSIIEGLADPRLDTPTFTLIGNYSRYLSSDFYYFKFLPYNQAGNPINLATDGIWWSIYSPVSIKSNNTDIFSYSDWETKRKIVEDNIFRMKERLLISMCGNKVCDRYPYPKLKIFNIFDYTGNLDCKKLEGLNSNTYRLDCTDDDNYQRLLNVVPSFNESPVNDFEVYGIGNPRVFTIILDNIDIIDPHKRKYLEYGKMIIILSPDKIYDSSGRLEPFGGDMYNFIRYLSEVTTKNSELDIINDKIRDSVDEIENKTIESDGIILSNRILDQKETELKKLLAGITKGGYLPNMSRYKSLSDKITESISSQKGEFYIDYYQPIISEYIPQFNAKIKEIESQQGYYQNREDFLREHLSDNLLNIQSKIETQTQIIVVLIVFVFTIYLEILLFILKEEGTTCKVKIRCVGLFFFSVGIAICGICLNKVTNINLWWISIINLILGIILLFGYSWYSKRVQGKKYDIE